MGAQRTKGKEADGHANAPKAEKAKGKKADGQAKTPGGKKTKGKKADAGKAAPASQRATPTRVTKIECRGSTRSRAKTEAEDATDKRKTIEADLKVRRAKVKAEEAVIRALEEALEVAMEIETKRSDRLESPSRAVESKMEGDVQEGGCYLDAKTPPENKRTSICEKRVEERAKEARKKVKETKRQGDYGEENAQEGRCPLDAKTLPKIKRTPVCDKRAMKERAKEAGKKVKETKRQHDEEVEGKHKGGDPVGIETPPKNKRTNDNAAKRWRARAEEATEKEK